MALRQDHLKGGFESGIQLHFCVSLCLANCVVGMRFFVLHGLRGRDLQSSSSVKGLSAEVEAEAHIHEERLDQCELATLNLDTHLLTVSSSIFIFNRSLWRGKDLES